MSHEGQRLYGRTTRVRIRGACQSAEGRDKRFRDQAWEAEQRRIRLGLVAFRCPLCATALTKLGSHYKTHGMSFCSFVERTSYIPPTRVGRVCLNCGRTYFAKPSANLKFCSARCYWTAPEHTVQKKDLTAFREYCALKSARIRKERERTCKTCAGVFVRRRGNANKNQRYCSKRCSNAQRPRNEKGQYMELPR